MHCYANVTQIALIQVISFYHQVVYDLEVKKGIEEAAKFIPLHAPATLDVVSAFEECLIKSYKSYLPRHSIPHNFT